MRPIKFRAWDKRRRKMMPVTDMNFYENLESPKVWASVCGDVDCGLCEEEYEEEDVVIMQYTGLTDKNGREIYEGDILKAYNHWKYTLGVVKIGEYNQDGSGGEYSPSLCLGVYLDTDQVWNFVWNDKEEASDYEKHATLLEFDVLEIIGNLYENTELVEDEE